jgi:hypothetical protein
MADDITYEVLERFGVLSESPRGWTKELRLINWNNRGPRFDLREWAPGDKKASRGITMSLPEMRVLQEILEALEIPEDDDEEESGEAAEAGEAKAEREAKEAGRKRKIS